MAGEWDVIDTKPAAGAWDVVTQTPTQQTQPPQSLSDVLASPDALAADIPQSQTPTPPFSVTALRDKIRELDLRAIHGLAPPPGASEPERFGRQAIATGVHLGAGLLQTPLNMLLGMTQTPTLFGDNPDNAVTIDPGTGRLGVTPEALQAGSLGAQPMRFGAPIFVPPGTFNPRAKLSPEFNAAPLTPELAARPPVEPGGPASPTGIAPPPTPEVGVTARPAGAQITPGYEAIHTPAEEAVYRTNAEGQKLLEPQVIGEPDRNLYIPGENANLAEQEQSVAVARDLKQLGIRTPEASQAAKEAAASNNTARVTYLNNTAKGPVDIYNRGVAREADINADKAAVFAPTNVTGPVDLQPVISHMEDVLNQPMNRQNSALQAVYRPLLERIKSANITDPVEAWSLRRDIDSMTSARAKADDRNLHAVAHDLNEVSGVVDKQIEDVAPGYQAMLDRYKDHSRAIDEMNVLQGATDKLRGPGQTLQYSDFQRFMKNVVDSRSTPSFDLNPYKAISDDNMMRLWNIRDSLRRSASAMDLARAAGSDTMPNIIDAMKAYGKLGGEGALHMVAGHLFGPGGNIALGVLKNVGKTLAERRTMTLDMQRMNQMLHPSEPLRTPPGQETP
jgi:hypothetical protein